MSYFGTIYADEDLPHRARAVYMYLRDRSGTAGSCWPGINTIASDLHLSRSTVKRALNERRFRPNGSSTSNLYTIR